MLNSSAANNNSGTAHRCAPMEVDNVTAGQQTVPTGLLSV